jgi:DNA-binding NarL/FixJ family response regulator
MIAACTFPLRLSGAEDILNAARTHQFAVTVRKGAWKRVAIADIQLAKREARQTTSPELDQLTFRQREILQLVAKGQNTKQIADMLGISVKTVEAHRLQLMRRLKIDNIPGLVRFAIRTGLVSAEA